KSNAVRDGACVPWLANTEAVHLIDLHVRYHLGWRDGYECNVLVGVYASSTKIISHPHGVSAWGKRHGKGHGGTFAVGFIHEWFQRFGIGSDNTFEGCLHGD